MGAQCLWEPKTMKTDPKCPPKCQLELLGLGFFILRINRSVLSLTSLRFPLSSFGTYIPSQRRLINSPSSVSICFYDVTISWCGLLYFSRSASWIAPTFLKCCPPIFDEPSKLLMKRDSGVPHMEKLHQRLLKCQMPHTLGYVR